MKILVSGGAGFIGSNLLKRFSQKYPEYTFFCLDKLSYASNLSILEQLNSNPNFCFLKADITNFIELDSLFKKIEFDHVIHLAAESHVDNSISNPILFGETNVMGTLNLLESARRNWESEGENLFYHVSTDEVFGSLGKTGFFSETSSYSPNSPYSASKAGSDHFVRAYHVTYNLPTVITNCSNNYGPYQHDEKLIPTVIRSIVMGLPIPVYGDGSNVRDWLYVEDHIEAIDLVFHNCSIGKSYCVGGSTEITNIELVELIIKVTDEFLGNPMGYSKNLISFVSDRKGHDFRYAIDHSHLTKALGWRPSIDLNEGLKRTVAWYCERYL